LYEAFGGLNTTQIGGTRFFLHLYNSP
jgi:hypothetical protein